MKFEKKNVVEILLVILAVFGIIYSFYNVLSQKILKSENRQEIQELSEVILNEQKQAERLKCVTKVYMQAEEKIQDSSETVQILYDYENNRMQTVKDNTKEIVEYGEKSGWVYSKGITPVYLKDEKRVQSVSSNSWYHYECENIYGLEKKNALTDTLSYGHLDDIDNISSIKDAGTEEIDGVIYTKYIVTIKNTLREDLTEDMGDTGLRKMLSGKGVDATFIKNTYPEVYDLLKEVYNSDTEELLVWVDQEGIMRKIEKDYTFSYYVQIIKKNIYLLDGDLSKYSYPHVKNVQSYKYNQETEMIEMPQKFIDL